MKFKKILAGFLAAVIASAAAVSASVTAGAESMLTAKNELVYGSTTGKLEKANDYIDYKFNVPISGTVEIRVNANLIFQYFAFADSEGKSVDFTFNSSQSTYLSYHGLYVGNSTTEYFNATFSAKLEPGTYYMRYTRAEKGRLSMATGWYDNWGTGAYTITLVIPQPERLIYRLYNTSNLEHLYTTDVNEVRTLVNDYGWNYEGTAWSAPMRNGDPVYRLYCSETNAHLYTTDTNERDSLLQNPIWSIDNGGAPLFYSAPGGAGEAVYRLYNEDLRQHLLTTNYKEYEGLVKAGWNGEGVKLYCSVLGDPELPMP